jgi:hypothetical protein
MLVLYFGVSVGVLLIVSCSVFLGTAAYLILGSWFNYQRYGARGWDLVPHGDFFRDVPYLAADWVRKVFDTLQGSGTRGGYTAV